MMFKSEYICITKCTVYNFEIYKNSSNSRGTLNCCNILERIIVFLLLKVDYSVFCVFELQTKAVLSSFELDMAFLVAKI